MKRRSVLGGLAAATLFGPLACARARGGQVLAFHYGWYGADEGWGVSADGGRNHPNVPADGLYESVDPAVVRRQIEQAMAAGVTGFITSWDGEGNRRDRVVQALLDAAPEGFSITAYLESAGGSEETLADRLRDLERRFAGSPRWLRTGSRPVLFVFDRVIGQVGLDGWIRARTAAATGLAVIGPANSLEEIEARRGAFDGLHQYSLTFVTDGWSVGFATRARRWMQRWVRAQDGPAVTTATVIPGYDDRRLDDRLGRRPVTVRRDGRTYRMLWDAALDARPDWVLIVSWNEWLEASEIEPSVETGRRELETTRALSARFLSVP